MITAFQVILLIIIPVSFILIYDAKSNKEKRQSVAFVSVGAMITFAATQMLL